MRLSADSYRTLGQTGLSVPPIVFGGGALGDVRRVTADQTKREICGQWFGHIEPPVVIDAPSRHAAGRALEVLGRTLDWLEIAAENVIIGVRLGWLRAAPPTTPAADELEVGFPVTHDVVERVGYDGMFDGWEEACRLLGGYVPRLVSVDGLDVLLAAGTSPEDRDRRFQDVLEAYRALGELRAVGKVTGVGAVASDWRVMRAIDEAVGLDWVMPCGAVTVVRHPPEVLRWLADLEARDVAVIGAGLLHGGFLAGGSRFDGRALHAERDEADRRLVGWRKSFVALCEGHGVTPVQACTQFALVVPGVVAARLESTYPDRVAENVDAAVRQVPGVFWGSMQEEGLLEEDYAYVG